MLYETVVKNIRIPGKDDLFHLAIDRGRFVGITTSPIQGEIEWEGAGGLALPPFVEMHTHLDTVLTAGKSLVNQSGTLMEGIQKWQERKAFLTEEDVMERATKALELLIQHGALYVRAAVDISDPNLTALKALLKLRSRFGSMIDLQIIAFPQDGLMSTPENQEQLVTAVKWGADAVSAVPHLERTRESGVRSLEVCFEIAKEHDVFVHIFGDEVDDEHSRYLEVIADLAIRERMEGRVTVSHANALAYYSDSYAAKVISLAKQAELTIVACPLINSAMQGRYDSYPKGRGITRVKELNDAGVNTCIAHDDIQSPFYPFGTGNLLQAAHMGAHLAHMTGKEDVNDIFKMITENGAKAFGLAEYGIQVGKEANFIILPTTNQTDALSHQPPSRYVFRKGQLIVETKPALVEWVEQRAALRDGGTGPVSQKI